MHGCTQEGTDSMPGDTWKITTFDELNETFSTATTLALLLRLPRWLSTRLQHTLYHQLDLEWTMKE
jgi:hypothetical protein